ncbi:hypothetical protein FB451DRAFT_985490, partial [Mycena latifolia]
LSRNGNFSGSFSEALFAPSAQAINYILANTTPQELHSALSNAITTGAPLSLTQRHFNDLLAVFIAAGVPRAAMAQHAVDADNVRHCARCHTFYYEKENGLMACVIPHEKRITMSDTVYPHLQINTHYSPCCVNLPTVARNHFEGRHTTIAKSVQCNYANIRIC